MLSSRLRQEIKKSLFTPLMLTGPFLALLILGFLLSGMLADNQFLFVGIYAVLCLGLFHHVAWRFRERTTDKSLKMIEVVYLATAFLGIYGVVDLQFNIAKSILSNNVPDIVRSLEDKNQCEPVEDKPEACGVSAGLISTLKLYGWRQDLVQWYVTEAGRRQEPAELKNREFWSIVVQLIAKGKQGFPVLGERDEFWAHRLRIFGFYLLCLGLSLRFTKTSAEIFEWHIPKGKQADIVLPTPPVNAHNSP